ncbi:MAG TPA: bifunctional phosphopantothenoylcysteine decarboxylase/phosphopantothenate--cysteine ligase CoaBC [Gemmatimonadales bacterium]|nr:bifunctional phosphopantothenoylcysteine decarboxylase/phosphopantothenate--cysteine ligase CoaBC [Gemmatimonadales bacterium]
MWQGRRVVLGVSGGIACYKSCIIARRLAEAGARVDVVLTQAAAEFVRPVTFEALTGRPVTSSLWSRDGALGHIRLGQEADLVIVAPATANVIARAAQGLADDFLTTMLLASTAPVLLAPAMNDEMFAAEPTVANLAALTARGFHVVGPETGPLAEGPSERPGRMSEPETILAHAARLLRHDSPLAGRSVVVTAGPTRESLDPVRVITNRSSGRMGFAIAEAAWARGADVLLISGPTALAAPAGIEVRRVETTADLEHAVRAALPTADVLIMAAAPADYRPRASAEQKVERDAGGATLALEPTADILAGTIDARKRGSVIVGFALETGDAERKALAKLDRKALDLIVVNDALEAGAGFEVETNRVTILARGGGRTEVPLQAKRDVAEAVLDAVERRLGG